MKAIARDEGILVERLGDELLLYDTRTDNAHAFDAQASAVWELADGSRDAGDIAAETGMAVAAVEHTLSVFAERGLLVVGVSRRDLLRTTGLVAGAGVAALPVIKSIAAPEAAHAVSCMVRGTACSAGTSALCCSKLCSGGVCQ